MEGIAAITLSIRKHRKAVEKMGWVVCRSYNMFERMMSRLERRGKEGTSFLEMILGVKRKYGLRVKCAQIN